MTEIKTKYSSSVHISNSGFNVGVEVRDLDSAYGASQYLTLSLHSFGIPLSTEMWLDDNVLDALEYVLDKARKQRAAFTMTDYDATKTADPNLYGVVTYSGSESSSD